MVKSRGLNVALNSRTRLLVSTDIDDPLTVADYNLFGVIILTRSLPCTCAMIFWVLVEFLLISAVRGSYVRFAILSINITILY
jgi:hypothetical protein